MPERTELSELKRALLAQYLRSGRPQAAARDGIPWRSPTEIAPLSFGQQQIWLLSQLQPDIPVYNERVTVHLPGSLDVNALTKSLNEIIRRHEAWRTIFPLVDGQPVQVIQPALHLDLPIVDLRALPEEQREAQAVRLASEDARRPFDLLRGPLLRALLIQMGDEEHRLFLTLHHIIFDGITIYQVFLPELSALYEAFSAGQPSPLPDLSIQYADFATWQRAEMQEQAMAAGIAYWKQQLAGAPAALELPTDRPRPAIPTYRGFVQPFALSTSLSARLRALCRQQQVTMYMLLLAAFTTLLYRYTEQEDILIGTATGGRIRPELEQLMGLFMNTVVMRSKLSGNPSFLDLLRQVRETTFEAQAHADVPFEYVVKELQPQRSLSYNPLFQVLFVFEPQHPVLPSGWTLSHMDAQTGISKFDLTLIAEERTEGIIGRFEYSTDLFDDTTIQRMIGHWQTLLESIVQHPDHKLSGLTMLTENERQRLLIEWNATTTAFPEEKPVHQLIEEQVERTPNAVALTYGAEQLTYRALNARANRLAHYLRRSGVRPEVIVGLLLRNSLEMIVGMLGVLKAGGAYIPLDPATPTDRLAFILRDARVSFVLTNRNMMSANGNAILRRGRLLAPTADVSASTNDDRLLAPTADDELSPATSGSSSESCHAERSEESAPGSAEILSAAKNDTTDFAGESSSSASPLYLDIDEIMLAGEPVDNPKSHAQGQHLAYIMYTSGSTGRPKGVAITHRNLWHSTLARMAYYREPVGKYLLLSALTFDSSVAGIYWTLCQGGTLLLPEEGVVRDPFLLSELIAKQQPSHTLCVPSLYNLLLEQASTHPLDSLQTVIVAGERCPKALVERHFTCLPNSALYNEYGPTEATVWCTVYRCQPGEERESVPIGRPIANTQVYVLDSHLQPVPVGVAGELYVGGAGIARGYVQRPEATSERFIPNPFVGTRFTASQKGARLYKTGDRVRYLPDGNIEFLERTDHQVKLRGYRIELGEIEEVLRRHPAVRDVAVIAREDVPGDTRLIAYVVSQDNAVLTIDDLHSLISLYVPVYMLPSAYILLPALPLLSNGKLDRKALPGPGPDHLRLSSNHDAYVPPRTHIEEVVAATWSQVLGIERIGIYDDFFRLGGHSLLAMYVVSRLRASLAVELPLRSFFETPTIAGLADKIMQMKSNDTGQQLPPIRSVSREHYRMKLTSNSLSLGRSSLLDE